MKVNLKIVIWFLCVAGLAYSIFRDEDRIRTGRDSIATVIYKDGGARVNEAGSVKWLPLANGDDLFQYDDVSTGEIRA